MTSIKFQLDRIKNLFSQDKWTTLKRLFYPISTVLSKLFEIRKAFIFWSTALGALISGYFLADYILFNSVVGKLFFEGLAGNKLLVTLANPIQPIIILFTKALSYVFIVWSFLLVMYKSNAHEIAKKSQSVMYSVATAPLKLVIYSSLIVIGAATYAILDFEHIVTQIPLLKGALLGFKLVIVFAGIFLLIAFASTKAYIINIDDHLKQPDWAQKIVNAVIKNREYQVAAWLFSACIIIHVFIEGYMFYERLELINIVLEQES